MQSQMWVKRLLSHNQTAFTHITLESLYIPFLDARTLESVF
jgi:hypothetical protein